MYYDIPASEAIDLVTPLAGTAWTMGGGQEVTLTFAASVPLLDVGTVVVPQGGVLRLVYEDGVRTDPTSRPRTVQGGSILSYVVAEVTDDGPLYRIALNRAGG